jgi:hypothetical protein
MFSWFSNRRKALNRLPDLSEWEATCPDCGHENGKLHELFCTKERCPFCGGQLISCNCMLSVLNLREEERRIVEEYIDDSVEPLKSILENWQQALNKKGRVPYHAMPLEPTADGLILAAARGALPFVRKLIADGVPVDATNDVNHTALMAAAWNSHTAIVTFLLSIGADVHRRNAHGHTPLHCSVATPSAKPELQRECAEFLLDQGAEVDALDHDGGTPLMDAAWFGCLPAVQLFLARGASASKRNERGQTAADLAHQRGHTEIARVLTTWRS